jgi:hypothetical protein
MVETGTVGGYEFAIHVVLGCFLFEQVPKLRVLRI